MPGRDDPGARRQPRYEPRPQQPQPPYQQPAFTRQPQPPYAPPPQQQPYVPPPRQRKRHTARNVFAVIGGAVAAIIVVSVAASNGGSTPSASTGGTTVPAQAAAKAPPVSKAPAGTASELEALAAAQNYLSDGQGFSHQGLIGQLDSSTGDNFPVADATWAVDHSGANWNDQAVDSAKGYMGDGQGFSRAGLIQQMTSAYGSQFTEAQAEYAANAVGL